LEITEETTIYTNKSITPFFADSTRFRNIYSDYLNFYSQINLSHYTKVITIEYEDLITDPYYLYQQLGQNRKINYNLMTKSPYDYTNLVINLPELRNVEKEILSNNLNEVYDLTGAVFNKKKKNRYAIYSPSGVTGADLIEKNINADPNSQAILIHRSSFPFDVSDVTCIISKRVSIFQGAVAYFIETKSTDLNKFHGIYTHFVNFYKHIPRDSFYRVIEIDYEPLMLDKFYLFKQLDIVRETNYNIAQVPIVDINSASNLEKLKEVANDVDDGKSKYYE
jgi:hypothetical protein